MPIRSDMPSDPARAAPPDSARNRLMKRPKGGRKQGVARGRRVETAGVAAVPQEQVPPRVVSGAPGSPTFPSRVATADVRVPSPELRSSGEAPRPAAPALVLPRRAVPGTVAPLDVDAPADRRKNRSRRGTPHSRTTEAASTRVPSTAAATGSTPYPTPNPGPSPTTTATPPGSSSLSPPTTRSRTSKRSSTRSALLPRTPRSWSSTTTPPTARARSPTGSARPSPASTSSTGRASRGSAPPSSPG